MSNKNTRIIFRITRKTNTLANTTSIVEFFDSYGMIETQIPDFPRGTVLEFDSLGNWTVVGYCGNETNLNLLNDAKCKEEDLIEDNEVEEVEESDAETERVQNKSLKQKEKFEEMFRKLKDVEDFYKLTKEVIHPADFDVISKKYAGSLCTIFKINPYFMFSPAYFEREVIDGMSISIGEISNKFPPRTFDERKQQIISYIDYELFCNEKRGNTGITYKNLFQKVKSRLKSINQPLNVFETNGSKGRNITAFINASNAYGKDGLDSRESCRFYMDYSNMTMDTLVFRKETFDIEKSICDYVLEWMSIPNTLSYRLSEMSSLCQEQKESVEGVFKNGNINIITGGPGTGKTTVISEIINSILNGDDTSIICVVAPTGKATKRIKESLSNSLLKEKTEEEVESIMLNVKISTIHKLVGFGKKNGNDDFEEENHYDIKNVSAVIIDESSMLPLDVFHLLLKSLDPYRTKIILVGDVDQLPSVDAGNVFNDLIDMGVPTSRLKINHRSSNKVWQFAKKFNNGVFDESLLRPILNINDVDGPGIYFRDTSNTPERLVKKEISDYAMKLEEKYQEDESNSWIVLSPIRDITADSFAENSFSSRLNLEIANKIRRLNNENTFVFDFAKNDRVIAVETQYGANEQNSYYNGDVGIIKDVVSDYNGKLEYLVSIDGNDYDTYIDQNKLELAYSLTIHKSQGSEYQFVNIYISAGEALGEKTKNKRSNITRKLLYTAITRAKSIVVIHASKKDLEYALNNLSDAKRTTYLQSFKTES